MVRSISLNWSVPIVSILYIYTDHFLWPIVWYDTKTTPNFGPNQDVNFSDLRKYDVKSSDLTFLPFSSGTTGMPKGVMLSHDNIVMNCKQSSVPLPDEPIIRATTKDFQDVLLCVLPFFHIYGFSLTLVSKLANGAKMVTMPSFQPDVFLKNIVQSKVTILHVVPPMGKNCSENTCGCGGSNNWYTPVCVYFIVLFMADHNMVQTSHLASVRSVLSGAAPIGGLDVERFMKKYIPHEN